MARRDAAVRHQREPDDGRTTVAARLKAIYGDVSNVDAFAGLLAEKHVPGSEMGELQRAIWQKQFAAPRDGDGFYYENDPLIPYLSSSTASTCTRRCRN